MQDAEIIARLIYAAWISPTPTDKDIEGFRAVMDCYARAARREEATPEPETCGDSCPITYPEPVPDRSDPDTEPADKLDGFEPVPLRAHDTHTHTAAGTNDGGEPAPKLFAGYGAGEKREIYARLMAFVAGHGLGARRKIAETSNGALQLSDVQDMTDAKRVPLSKWRVAAAAMDWIEEQERQKEE